MTKEKNKEGLNIELAEEIAQGVYSNLAIINHSPSEFIVDFIQMMPGVPKAKVKSRVIMSPMHTKNLLLLLNAKIKEYERKFGKIELPKKKINQQNIKLPDDTLPN